MQRTAATRDNVIGSITPSSDELDEAISFGSSPERSVYVRSEHEHFGSGWPNELYLHNQPATPDWENLSPGWRVDGPQYPGDMEAFLDPSLFHDWEAGVVDSNKGRAPDNARLGVSEQECHTHPQQQLSLELNSPQRDTATEGPRVLEQLIYTPDVDHSNIDASSTWGPKLPTTPQLDAEQPCAERPAVQYVREVLQPDVQNASTLLQTASPVPAAPPGKKRITRQPALYGSLIRSSRTRDSIFCQEFGCGVSCKRGSDLERHIQTVHAQAGKHYHSTHPGCEHQNRRLDRLQAHCRHMHTDEPGAEKIEEVDDEVARSVGGCRFAGCTAESAGLIEGQRRRRNKCEAKRKRDHACCNHGCCICGRKLGRARANERVHGSA